MNEFNIAVKDILDNFLFNLQKGILENDSIVGFYYIKNHIENELFLSQENIEYANAIATTLDENYEKNDLKILITLYLLKSIINIKKDNFYKNEFFKYYLNFQDLQNILDNKDLIKMLYPQEKFLEYLEYLNTTLDDENFFEKDLALKEKIIYIFHFITTMFYEREEKAFKQMYKYLYRIFLEAIEKNDEEVVFYLYFPLQFSWNGVSTRQEEFEVFNNEVERALEKYIKDKLIPKYKLKPIKKDIEKKKVKKIAFIHDRLINYSIFNVFYGLLQALKENKSENCEFIILDLNFPQLGGSDIKIQKKIKELGFTFIECHERFFNNKNVLFTPVQKCLALRKIIIDMEIDVLIGMHSQAEYNFLFTTRTAPLQIYWSHGNLRYNIDNIDKKLSHLYIDETSQKIDIPVDIKRYNPHKDNKQIESIRKLYPKDSLILGTIGRLTKLNSDIYLETISKIMKKYPKSVFIACGSGDSEELKLKLEKLSILDRFYFPGHIDANIYGHIIDIWLDSFPYSNGESKAEFYYKTDKYAILSMLSQNKEEHSKYINQWYESNKESIDSILKKRDLTKKDFDFYNNDVSLRLQAFDEIDYYNKAIVLIDNYKKEELKKEFLFMKELFLEIFDQIAKDSLKRVFDGL